MKNINYFIIICAIVSQILTGCKDDTTPSAPPVQEEVNKLFFNGAGYNNVSVFPFAAIGYYSSNNTYIGFNCIIGSDTLVLTVITPGQLTGTYNWITANNYAMLSNLTTNINYRNGINSGTTVITSYGAVSQKIEGSYNGKVMAVLPPYDTVSVSCSKFSVIRYAY